MACIARSVAWAATSWIRCPVAMPRFRCVTTATEILLRKSVKEGDFTIAEQTPVRDAVHRLASGQWHALVVVNGANRVIGIVTARDLLRSLDSSADGMTAPVRSAMTTSDVVVHVKPSDSLTQCALLMSECKVSHLPVISDGEVKGIISLQDISDVTLEPARGGKAAGVQRVLPRRGISAETTVARSHQHAVLEPLFLRTGAAALPRPPIRNVQGPSEDACFMLHVAWPGVAHSHVMTYIGLADGVGSWHEKGVDPRLYARRLMSAAAQYVWQRAAGRHAPPSTLDVLVAAWETVRGEQLVGSATASIIALDSNQNQLSITGLGDCGVVLLRDTDMDRVGTLLRGGTASGIRPGWRVSARSTQQLRGFNQPYQLGYAPGFEHKFEKPWQGETLTLPVHPEDIIIAASDGLFDNLDETDILTLVDSWDGVDCERRRAQQVEQRRRGRALAAALPAVTGHAAAAAQLMDGRSQGADILAHMLVNKARELSLDRMRDGPFARLAKENDVIWTKGGRPDDTSVIVARVSTNEPSEAQPVPPVTSDVDVTCDAITAARTLRAVISSPKVHAMA